MKVEHRMRCPHCHSVLLGSGDALRCPTHGVFTRSAAGVYLFLKDEAGYFQKHWKYNHLVEIPLAKRETGIRFLSFLFNAPGSGDNGMTWLDVGTGDGVHLALSKEICPEVDILGLDISGPGLETVARRFPEATLLKADGQSIPLQDNAVDACFSYGTLAYMDDPWQGLSEIVRVTKPGGLIGVWFYPKRTDVLGLLFRFTRSVFKILPAFCRRVLADLIVPFLPVLPTASGVSLKNASWKACREVVLVNVAPPNLIFPTKHEVCEALARQRCSIVYTDDQAPISIWARKSSGETVT